MSLVAIISQLQSIQPRGKSATAESLSFDIMRARDSLLNLAKLLQASGTMRGGAYQPEKARASQNEEKISKNVQKNTISTNRIDSDQKRLKQFTEQSVKQLNKQLALIKQTNGRSQNAIKTIQNEIGLGRPQKLAAAVMSGTASQIPSYGRNIRAQLNRLNQQVRLLDANQQRILDENEKLIKMNPGGQVGPASMGIIGRPNDLPFAQRLDYMRRLERQAVSSALPRAATKSALFGTLLMMASAKGGDAFTKEVRSMADMISEIIKNPTKIQDLIKTAEDIRKLPAGTPYMVDDKVKIKNAKELSYATSALTRRKDELKKLIAEEKDSTEKKKLETELQDVDKRRLELMMEEGIVTQDHVTAGMATEVTYAQTEDGKYVDINVVKKYPTIWTDSDNDGLVELISNWEEEIKKEEIAKTITKFKLPKPKSEEEASQPSNIVRVFDKSGNVIEIREGGNLNWRNNNPGNIEYGDFAKEHGAIGENGRFAIFPTMETGKKAADALLKTANYKNLTIAEAIARWSPEGDGDNDPVAYAEFVEKQTGIDVDTVKYTELDSSQQQKILDAMEKQEGGQTGKVYKGEELAEKLKAMESETNVDEPPPLAAAGPEVQVPIMDQADVDAALANVSKDNMDQLETLTEEAYAHGLAAMNTLKALGQKVAKHDEMIAQVNNKATATAKMGSADFKVTDPNFFPA